MSRSRNPDTLFYIVEIFLKFVTTKRRLSDDLSVCVQNLPTLVNISTVKVET